MEFNEIEIGTYWRHYFEASQTYSIKEYAYSIDSVKDKVKYLSDILRLCKVLCLEEDKKYYGNLLYNLLKAKPELESPQIYRDLADSLRGDNFIPFALKSLELCEAGSIEEQLKTYSVLSSAYYEWAVFHNDDEAFKKFENIQYKRLEIGIKYYGEFHPYIKETYQDLSLGCGDVNKGLEYAQRAIEIGTAIYGHNHPSLGRPNHYMGCLYRSKRDWENAYNYFICAYNLWIPAYGIFHEIMVSSCGNIANSLLNLGRYEEALEYYKKCLIILNKIYKAKGYDYAICAFNTSKVLHALHQDEESIRYCREAEQILLADKTGQERIKNALKVVKEFYLQFE